MKYNFLLKYTALTCLLTFSGLSHAGILLDKSIVDFPSDQPPRQDITVSNQGDEIAYVQVQVLEVTNPGTDQEERRPISDKEDISFVASPSKLAIPPNGRKQVRLVNLSETPGEKVYRINFTPVLPPLDDSEGMGVRVVIAYQVLALIHPQDPIENLIIKRDAISLQIQNKGNSYALITEIRQCDKNGSNCQDDLGSKRLYAGNSMTIALPYQESPATFKVTNFKGAREETAQ